MLRLLLSFMWLLRVCLEFGMLVVMILVEGLWGVMGCFGVGLLGFLFELLFWMKLFRIWYVIL